MSELFNINLKLLYKETELKYQNDDEVDPDDSFFLCDELYRLDLLNAFFLETPDFDILNKKLEKLYNAVKEEPEIINLIKEHMFLNDEITTFMTLFSYEYFYIIYPILAKILLEKVSQKRTQSITI